MNKIPHRGAVGDIAGTAKNRDEDARNFTLNCQLLLSQSSCAAGRTSALLLGLPFDVARHQYASAVRVGLIQRSMLAWAKFEQTVSALEQLILGPWARHV